MNSRGQAESAIILGIMLGNLGLMTAKLIAGSLGASSALIADGIHSAADVVSSLVVFFSVKVSQRPPDDDHPYGHGKIEAIAAGIIALILAVVAVQIAVEAIGRVSSGSNGAPASLTAIIALISIFLNELMFQVANRYGKRVGSPVMIANSWDNRSDALSSLAALFGIIGARAGYTFLDPLAAAIVAVLLMRVVFNLLRDAGHELMDRTMFDVRDGIIEIAEDVEGVEHAYARVRRFGRKLLVDLKLEMDPEMSVSFSHDIGRTVKAAILRSDERISSILIHIHPHDH